MENRTAVLDPRVLARARNRLGLELVVLVVVVLGLAALGGVMLTDVGGRGAFSAVAAALVLGASLWPLSVLVKAARDVPDLLARHYLLITGEDDLANHEARRRPWRDAIASL